MPEIGDLVLAKPHEEQQLFSEFIDYVMSQERDADDPKYSEVRYAQTRMTEAYSPLSILN